MCRLGCGPHPIWIKSDRIIQSWSIGFGLQHSLVTVQYVPSSFDLIVPSFQMASKSDIWHSFRCRVSLSFLTFHFLLGLMKCTSSHANTGWANYQKYDRCLRWISSPSFNVGASARILSLFTRWHVYVQLSALILLFSTWIKRYENITSTRLANYPYSKETGRQMHFDYR